MFKRKKKESGPVIPPRVVDIGKGYYDLSFEDQRAFLENLVNTMSPNEEVRRKAYEEAKRWRNQA